MPVPNPIPQFTFFDKSVSPPLPKPTEPPTDLRWLRVEEFLRSRELAPNTRKAYERDLRKFIEWTNKPWHSITHRDLDRYKEELKQRRSPQGKPLTPATINRQLAALGSLFKWLTARDYISKDPTLLLESLKLDEPESKELSDAEIAALYEAAQQQGETVIRDVALLRVLEHGLRASEVSALNIKNYDGTRLVNFYRVKTRKISKVPLLKGAQQALDAYLGWKVRQGLPVAPESPLFVSLAHNSWGKRLSYWGIYKIVEGLAEMGGVKNCHPHRLRHSFGTNLVLNDLDSQVVKELMGHESDRSNKRYIKRALEIKAEKQFYERMERSKSDSQERQ